MGIEYEVLTTDDLIDEVLEGKNPSDVLVGVASLIRRK